MRFSGYGQALVYVYENAKGYQAGNRYAAGLAADVEVVRPLRLGGAIDILNEQPERWGGFVQQDGNVGRTDLLAGGSIAYRVDDIALSLAVKVPVWQHFIASHGPDPGQLTYPAIVSVAVATAFGRR
jgi:hypothetical protein